MAPRLPAPFAPRPRLRLVLLVPALVLICVVGCSGHRRSSLRPIYVSPSPAPCPSASVVPRVSSPATISPSFVEPSSSPMVDRPSPPASMSPPAPGPVEEPSLDPNPPDNSKVPRSKGLDLKAPGASLGQPSGGLRQTSLRERLRPFVNDPDDLFGPPKADRPWKYVVLHHSANATGGYDQIDREHRKVLGWDGCGYHFVIGNGTGSPDGQIEVAQRWSNQKIGIHCRNGKNPDVSDYGVGICLVGDLDHTPATPRQVESARTLVAYLSSRYAIPADRIGTHAMLANTPTACPGKLFPVEAILGSRGLAQR